MPVHKYRRGEDIPPPPPRPPFHPDTVRAFVALLVRPPIAGFGALFPAGVRKHRTMAEHNAARADAERERAQRIRAARA